MEKKGSFVFDMVKESRVNPVLQIHKCCYLDRVIFPAVISVSLSCNLSPSDSVRSFFWQHFSNVLKTDKLIDEEESKQGIN